MISFDEQRKNRKIREFVGVQQLLKDKQEEVVDGSS